MLRRKNYTSLILIFMIAVIIIGIKPLSSFAMPQLFTRVEEEDTDPSVSATKIKFPNSSETDNGDGSVSISFDIAGGWTYTDPNHVALTDPNDILIVRNLRFVATDSDVGNINISTDDKLLFTGFSGGISTDSIGTYGAWGYTGEHIALTDSSSNTNAGLGEYFEISSSITAGKVMAAEYSRLMCRTAQTNQCTLVGTESQFRLYGVNLADGVHAGLWAVAEQSGTSVLSGGGTFNAISATVESAAGFETGATEHVTGITIDSSINAGATINASTNFSGIYIKSNGKDWFDGLHITGATNDIKLKNGATINNTSADLLTITEVTVKVAGDLNLAGTLARKFTITTDNTNGAATHTAAEMAGGLIRRGTGNEITGDATDVTDTAANIVAGIPGCVVGSGYEFSIANEDDTNTVCLDGGTSVTLVPNDPSTAIPANATGRFLLVVTNATAASEAVSVYALGYSTH